MTKLLTWVEIHECKLTFILGMTLGSIPSTIVLWNLVEVCNK